MAIIESFDHDLFSLPKAYVRFEKEDTVVASAGGIRLISGNQRPEALRIIPNPPYTIVLWKDGTKTIVKCTEDDNYSVGAGFAAAVVKKLYGGKNCAGAAVRRYVAAHTQVPKPKKTKKPKKENSDAGSEQ